MRVLKAASSPCFARWMSCSSTSGRSSRCRVVYCLYTAQIISVPKLGILNLSLASTTPHPRPLSHKGRGETNRNKRGRPMGPPLHGLILRWGGEKYDSKPPFVLILGKHDRLALSRCAARGEQDKGR